MKRMPGRIYPNEFPEPFAIEWGHDEYGTFMSFAVENVVQRMRWIPPGSFMMGSPESEVGRIADEIQHCVELSQGYWLGDTPVTQALWEAVMGTNPSRFKAPNNPLETVSWEICQVFMAELNVRVPCLHARLPTEAEWEYACRANTTTETWVDDPQPDQEKRAQQLDAIAWFRVNSGATTHPVAQKLPNPWGLHDMLGNVWEWCADWYTQYDVKALRDPVGPHVGSRRVIRGGSWDSGATLIRAANRYAYRRGRSFGNFGFRLARSPATRISEKK